MEEFVGMHSVHSLKSNTLVAVWRDVLTRLNLSIQDCRGQCYDGASNMAGAKNGVATQILAEEPRAIIIHTLQWPRTKPCSWRYEKEKENTT